MIRSAGLAIPPPAAPAATPIAAVGPDRPIGYIEASAYPLTSLLFVVPLIIAYEFGTRWYASDPVSHVEQRIVAFNLMQQFFALLGMTGQCLPAATVGLFLTAWHLSRGDAWAARSTVLLGMAVESAMYAIPLVALGFAFQHYLPLGSHMAARWLNWHLAGPPASGSPRALIVLSIGAGVYEELIFRLVFFTVLGFLLMDMCKLSRRVALPVMIVTSAIAFSLYHYRPSGLEDFHWESFAFRTAAGVYFGVIYAYRGFGITAGSHAAYDVCIVLLKAVGPV
jgi:hypothetical protein